MSPVRTFRPWWPVLGWAAAILVLTSAPMSAPEPARGVPHLDKAAHFGLFLGLGWSVARALLSSGLVTLGSVLGALAGGLAYGAFTEWLQRAIATRDPSFGDWAADAAGVSLGLAACLWPRPGGGGRGRGAP